jgi:hypothetical protein
MMSMKRVALFITYTMVHPVVGGAFMRSLRLATEMARRGWDCIICNHGPDLRDPKISAAPSAVRIVTLDRDRPGLTSAIVREEFRALKPSVVVMGESPFTVMEIFYEAAKGLDCPFIVLDQFYYPSLLPACEGVDLILLYALATFWSEDLRLPAPYELTPPFVEAVTRKLELPVPATLPAPWITLVAYDEQVCQNGIELLSLLGGEQPAIIAITSNPEKCLNLARSNGLALDRFVTLPLQSDANVFGFFAASAVSIVSNGFLQIMEVLAMGCPVIALARESGVGMSWLNIGSQFVPYASFKESRCQQLDRMRRWLRASPFPPEIAVRLGAERHGCSYCANRIEQVYRQARASSRTGARRGWLTIRRIMRASWLKWW